MEISTQNKTVLLFSDVHQEIGKLESILAKENYDIAVSLGDWFDSRFYDGETDVIKACNFLKKWLFKPNFFTCIGNHDIQYLYGNPATICSGYRKEKNKIINEQFGSFFPAIREKFLWYLWIDDYFCSHAGINPVHFRPNQEINKLAITKWLDEQIKFAEPSLINNGYHWLYGCGQGRGGRLRAGGITWNCFDSEFEAVEGLKQIVGHTSHSNISNHYLDGNMDIASCDNIDIDCHLNQYLLIQNGKLIIKDYKDL